MTKQQPGATDSSDRPALTEIAVAPEADEGGAYRGLSESVRMSCEIQGVTPEMIRAGIKEYWDWGESEEPFVGNLAARIYLAMLSRRS